MFATLYAQYSVNRFYSMKMVLVGIIYKFTFRITYLQYREHKMLLELQVRDFHMEFFIFTQIHLQIKFKIVWNISLHYYSVIFLLLRQLY